VTDGPRQIAVYHLHAKSVEHAAQLGRFAAPRDPVLLRQNAVATRQLELSLQFHRRFDADAEEAREFFLAGRAAPFDDVVHNRLGRRNHLRL
jgi:hypothetical protein